MKVSKAATIWIDYHRGPFQKKIRFDPTSRSLIGSARNSVTTKINQVSSDDVLRFLNRFTEGNKPYTKRIRYSHICSLFNFIRNNLDHSLTKSMRFADDPKAVSAAGGPRNGKSSKKRPWTKSFSGPPRPGIGSCWN